MFERKGIAASRIGKAICLDLKALSEDGEFEGWAARYGTMDRGGDICLKGCVAESLRQRPANKVKMLWQHETDDIIGKWIELREEEAGLYAKGKLFTSIDKARDALTLMREGQLDGLSIGYRTIDDAWDADRRARLLKQIELREISVVTFPMHEDATVSLVKGDKLPTERDVEKYLRDGGFSAKQSKMFIAKGYRSLLAGDEQNNDEDALNAIRKLRELIRS